MRESVIYQEILREGQQLKGATLILRQLTRRRFSQLAPVVRSLQKRLPVVQLEELGEALLDFSSVQDLTDWLLSLIR